jgi:hypothetical protein
VLIHMNVRHRRLRAALVTSAAVLATLPAAAQAAEICVTPATGCTVTNTRDTLTAALQRAGEVDMPGKDTIKLGAATYDVPANQSASSEVEIVGAGIASTTIKGPDAAASWTFYLNGGGTSAIKNLTVQNGPLTSWGLIIYNGGTVENIVVKGHDSRADNDRGLWFNGSGTTARNVTVALPTGDGRNDWAVYVNGGGAHTFEDVNFTGDNALVIEGNSNVTLRRASLKGHRTLITHYSGTADIYDSVVRTTLKDASEPRGLEARASGTNVSKVTATRTTVRGPGTGIGARSHFEGACNTGHATVELVGTTVSNFATSSLQPDNAENCTGGSFPQTCPAPVGGSQNVQWTNSHAQNGISVNDGCRGYSNSVGGDPGFVSDADLRPRQPSPLIDTGDTSPSLAGDKDFAGAARVVDGDAAGGARRDIGAYEYQRLAPSVTASVNPSSGVLTTDFGFSAAGTDPDGEALQYIWTFSDGNAAPGTTINKKFGTLGSHSGTVQAIDAAGLTATSTAAVSVTNGVTPPAPTPTPTVVPKPPDTTGPSVTVKGGNLKADKKGVVKVTITCPASETAPCQIAIAASSAKKIVLRRGKKKIQSLGKGSGSVPAGKSATVTFKLSKNALRYLKRKKKIPATLAVTATDAAGNSAKASAKATIKK